MGAGRERLVQGLAPTEEAEREWYRLERERLTLEDTAVVRTEDERLLDAKV